jgi:deoxyribodipyrimidine photo-lyase
MARRIAIALLRNDLRVSDNPILYAARDAPGATHLLPLFVFDERQIELSGVEGFRDTRSSSYVALPEARTRICGFWRTGRHRAWSVLDLFIHAIARSSPDP